MLKVIGGVPDGLMKAIADGAVTSNKPVIIQSDGTVADIDPTASSVPQSEGTPATFDTSTSYYQQAGFDSTNNKVVITYRDVGTSSYGAVVVGTVNSNNSITFGTRVIYQSSEQYDRCPVLFDPSNGKVIIFFNNASLQPAAIVGTVSGNSISFGSAVAFDTSQFLYTQASAAFDTGNNKAVTCYYKSGSESGAIVGTVSGTSISFGSVTNFYSGAANNTTMGYDSNAGKVIVTYQQGNSGLGCKVGTVSGTSISFGAETTINSGGNVRPSAVSYVSGADKTVVTYHDNDSASTKGKAVVGTISGTSISFGSVTSFGNSANIFNAVASPITPNSVSIGYSDRDNSNYGTVIVGTVSGSSISFNTKAAFTSETTLNGGWGAAYDSNLGKVVFAYGGGTSAVGKAVAVQTAYSATNLTEENYVGIAQNPASTGTPVKIGIIGSVVGNQTGLTAGEKYYVQGDGSLSTTPDSPSVLAGTAISATQLVVKT